MLVVRLLPRIFQNQGLRLSDETARSPNRRIGIQVAGWAVVAMAVCSSPSLPPRRKA